MKRMLRSLTVAAGLAATLVVGSALPALAHHVNGIQVGVSCEGYSGTASLNVFNGHKYRVTAPGFDTGVITTPAGPSANVSVDFSGPETSGTVTATIYYPNGGVEDSESESFALEQSCEPRTVDHNVQVATRMPQSVSAVKVLTCDPDDEVVVSHKRFKHAMRVSFSCGEATRSFRVFTKGQTLVIARLDYAIVGVWTGLGR